MKLMDFGAFDDVTDPSDFPTENLQKLDSSLRCTICKDFYDAPVMLHCGHTFCSLCIRSVLPNKPECPICRVAAKETHLVRNSMFDDTVHVWSDVRALVLKFSKDSLQLPATPNNLNNKRKLSLPPTDPIQEAGPSRLRYGYGEHVAPQVQDIERTERPRKSRRLSIEEEIVISSDPEEQELPNHANKNLRVTCPLCSRQVPYNSINPHMDSNCKKYILGDGSLAIATPNSKAAWGSIFKGQGKKAPTSSSAQDLEIPTTRMAKVSYGLLALSSLRKLLAETGLPTTGDKDELITRHERWIAIYNANLDRARPKTVGELKRHLKELEDAGNRPGPKKIVDEKAWAQKNSAQFASLIVAARPKPNSAKEGLSFQQTASGLPPSPPLEKDPGTTSNAIAID